MASLRASQFPPPTKEGMNGVRRENFRFAWNRDMSSCGPQPEHSCLIPTYYAKKSGAVSLELLLNLGS